MPVSLKQITKALLKHEAVREVEDEGMDEGRFFVHLKQGWLWTYDDKNKGRSKSFGSLNEARHGLKHYLEEEPVLAYDD